MARWKEKIVEFLKNRQVYLIDYKCQKGCLESPNQVLEKDKMHVEFLIEVFS